MAAADTDSLLIGYHYTQLGACPAGAQSWHFDVHLPDLPGKLGHGEAVLVDLYGRDPYGSLDRFGPPVHKIRAATMDPQTRELCGTWADELDMYGDRLVILSGLTMVRNRAALAGAVVAHVVAQLGSGAIAVVYRPGGDDLPNPYQLRSAGLHFYPIRNGVHYLDPMRDVSVHRADDNRRPPGRRLRAC